MSCRRRWPCLSVHRVTLSRSCVIFFFLPPFDVPPLYATRRCSQTSPLWKSNHLIHMTFWKWQRKLIIRLSSAHKQNKQKKGGVKRKKKPVFVLKTITNRRNRQRNPPRRCVPAPPAGPAFQHRGAVHRSGKLREAAAAHRWCCRRRGWEGMRRMRRKDSMR